MNYPVKPWEMGSLSNPNLSVPQGPAYVPNTDRLHSSAVPFPGTGGGGSAATNSFPPPVPPRPNQTRPIYSSYNRGSMMPYSYSSPYSSYGGYGGGYSPYSPYSSYGYGGGGGYYGNRPYYDSAPGGELSFSQLAEESSASAFQSIESFVSAFGSISMMLESTFHALYSSFRAVVGVADHLGRVKQVFSALAIFRFFKWMFRRIMYLIGLTKIKPETIESLWSEASVNAPELEDAKHLFGKTDPSKPSSWPILMFLGFICAGPYLMWKLVKSLNLDGSSSSDQHRQWAEGECEHFIAEVKYPFDAGTERELSVKQGQTVRLAPAKFQPNNVRGWALASDGSRIGLLPLNYIKVLGKRSGNVSSRVGAGSNNTVANTASHDLFSGQDPKVLQTSRPRVRFNLNPRPASPDNTSNRSSDHELTGILVKNENTSVGVQSNEENDGEISRVE